MPSRHDEKPVEHVGVVLEHMGDAILLDPQIRVLTEAEVDHAAVRLSSSEDQLAEVPVVRDEDALLAPCDSEQILIFQAGGMISGDCRDIVIQGTKPGSKASVCALIQQESHAVAGTESASRASRAYSRAACTSSIERRG